MRITRIGLPLLKQITDDVTVTVESQCGPDQNQRRRKPNRVASRFPSPAEAKACLGSLEIGLHERNLLVFEGGRITSTLRRIRNKNAILSFLTCRSQPILRTALFDVQGDEITIGFRATFARGLTDIRARADRHSREG